MDTNFSFKSSIKDVQNRLITQSIRDTSNLELLRSEEAIQSVIKSYTDKFKAIGGMLFDVSQYLVNSKDIIQTEKFNELFESIYIDLYSLYSDLSLVEQVLELNLQRNKNFFLIIKKRIKDLWNKLALTRLYIYDQSPSDESFYESFFTDINAANIQNVTVDKKLGYLHLKPKKRHIQNLSHLVKKITSVTYPVNSDNGGALHTTNDLNTFVDNYTNGPRDMLHNGLWKEEVICNEIPNLIYDIGSSGVSLVRNYRGILSIVDIEYVYPVGINRLDIDIFGDKSLLIDAVLYKETENSDWKVANFALENPLLYTDPSLIDQRYAVRGNALDVIGFYNIQKINAKFLRIVFNQQNYDYIDTKDTGESGIDFKIQTDLNQRRYELVKFGTNYEEALATPINDANVSLYNKIISVIESVSNVESLLEEIQKILLPQANIVTYDFTRALQFEFGAWSIEPILENYERQFGIFDSKPYSIKDKSLISVSLRTKQVVPESTACSWYINIGNKDIPIIENSSVVRKEKINPISLSNFTNFQDWSPGSFILLDFPVDPFRVNEIGIYTNGEYTSVNSSDLAFLNSRLLFIKNLEDPYRSEFTIKYPAAVHSSVNLYSLALKPTAINANNIISLGVVCSRKAVLEAFIESVRFSSNNDKVSSKFSITNSNVTLEESKDWFGQNFTSCLFISSEVENYFNLDDLIPYSNVITVSPSKVGSTQSDMLSYFSGTGVGYSDLSVLGTVANLVPFNIARSI